MSRTLRFALFLMVLAVLAVACSEDEHGHGEEDLDAEICEHMADGPAQAVVASVDAAAEHPDVSARHTRFDVALSQSSHGAFLGYVALPVGTAGDYIIAVDRELMVSGLDPSGAAVAVETSAPNPDCANVTHHVLELPVGTSTLVFASADQDQVSVVIEPAAHEGE